MAFAAVGLVGGAGIWGAQVPYEHALARDAALRQVLADQSDPAKLIALRPALDDSADRVLTGQGTLASRVATERQRSFAAFTAEAHRVRLRMLVGLAAFTAGGALFGAVALSVVGRSPAA